jgi:hypothetical protein
MLRRSARAAVRVAVEQTVTANARYAQAAWVSTLIVDENPTALQFLG